MERSVLRTLEIRLDAPKRLISSRVLSKPSTPVLQAVRGTYVLTGEVMHHPRHMLRDLNCVPDTHEAAPLLIHAAQ